MDEHYRRSHTKTTDVECRVCSKTLIQQNYQAHLKRKHPAEDCNDLRPRDQRTLLSFFGKPSKKIRDDTKEDEVALTIQSLEENTVTDAGLHNNQESGKLNENDHTEEIEAKGNQHDQFQFQEIQELFIEMSQMTILRKTSCCNVLLLLK
jgi:phage FluMu protein Com